jgi:hypothetical protein
LADIRGYLKPSEDAGMVSPENDFGLKQKDVARLLAQSVRNLHRLRHHPNPAMRYPAPDFEINGRPIWRLSTHLKFVRQHKPRRPVVVDQRVSCYVEGREIFDAPVGFAIRPLLRHICQRRRAAHHA